MADEVRARGLMAETRMSERMDSVPELRGIDHAGRQQLVSEHDLSQVKRAFDLNGYVGILYLLTTAAAIYAH